MNTFEDHATLTVPRASTKPAANNLAYQSGTELAPAQPSAAASGRWYLHICLVSLLSVASLAPIWVAERFPSQNGPWYLLLVHMFEEFDNPAWNYSDYYQINWHPVPHMLHEALLWVLFQGFPLLTAEKIALSFEAILIPLSVFYLLSTVAPKNLIFGYLSFLMIHSYTFYRGYHDFTLSVSLSFLVFGLWYRHRSRINLRVGALLALGACATYLSHLFTFALLACAIGCVRLVETRSITQAVKSALCATWPGWLLVFDYLFLVRTRPGGFTSSDTSFLLPHVAAENFVRKMFYSISLPAYIVGALPWLWAVHRLGQRFVQLRRQLGLIKGITGDPILVVTLILAAGYFIVPDKLIGWHFVSTRMIPLILGLALACGAPFDGARANVLRTAFLASVTGSALCVDWFLSQTVLRMNETVAECVSGIASFKGNSPLLPILAENEPFGLVRPVTRLHEYYHIAKGGGNGFSVAAYSHLTSLWYRAPVSTRFPTFDPEDADGSMQRIKETYGYVLLWGEDQDWVNRMETSGFRLVHHDRRLRLFENQHNPLTIQNNIDDQLRGPYTALESSTEESQ